MISTADKLQLSPKPSSSNNLPQPHQIELNTTRSKTGIDNLIIPKIDSNLLFDSKSSSDNIELNSMSSFKKTPSSNFHLDLAINDSSLTNDNGSLEQFKTSQELSKSFDVEKYFEDFYRREIEISQSATKEECLSILEPYSIEHYATKHFRKQPGILIFNKKGLKKLTTFSLKPFHHPLLEKTPLSKKDVVDKLSSYILIYIGVKHDAIQDMYYRNRKEEQKTLLFLAIIYILHNDESLVNECFMHIMKAMRDVPTQESLLLCWKLFLTISSLFYVTDWDMKNVIRWFIVNRMFYDDILGKYAKYSLICFHDRTVLGRSIDFKTTKKDIVDVPLGLTSGKKTFKCSLYTQMWDQRRKLPKLPIPLAAYLVVKTLIKKGVMKTAKPFPYIKTPTLMQRSVSSNSKNNESKSNRSDEKVENKKEEEQNNKNIEKNEIKNDHKNVIQNNTNNDNNNDDDSSDVYEEEEEEEEEEYEEESNEEKQDKQINIEKDEIINKSKQFFNSTKQKSSSFEYEEEEEEEEESSGDELDVSVNTCKQNRLHRANMRLLNEWSEKIFDDEDIIDDGKVSDLMGFLLMWMHNLIDPIIPKSMANSFIDTFSNSSSTINDFKDFIDDLPLLHKNTLKYIVGFFREIAKNEKFTQVSNQSIADDFASYFVCTSFTTVDPFTRQKMTDFAPRFLLYCLENLDVDDLYPLNPCYESRNDE